MSRNPDTEDCNIDHRDDNCRTPFQSPGKFLVLCNNRDSVDDNLHQQLYLKYVGQ